MGPNRDLLGGELAASSEPGNWCLGSLQRRAYTDVELVLRGGASTRFHPKRRASNDHRPGPNIARAALMVPSNSQSHLSPGSVRTFHASMTATEIPTMGVHSPSIRRSPASREMRTEIVSLIGGSLQSRARAHNKRGPDTRRMRSSPVPGQPPANVEYKRRNTRPSEPRMSGLLTFSDTPKRVVSFTLSRFSMQG